MRTKNSIKIILSLLLTVALFWQFGCQDKKAAMEEMMEEDRKLVEALAMYPKGTRLAILEVSKYPKVIEKVGNIQEQSSASFKDLVKGLERAEQEKMWELSRFPDLMDKIATGEKKSAQQIRQLLSEGDYPEEVHDVAVEVGTEHYSLLTEVSELNKSSEQQFNKAVENLPQSAREAFRHLVEEPEVLTILTENIDKTAIVGKVYKKEPDWVIHNLDSLHTTISRQKEQELEDWKQTLEENPEAKEEFQRAADQYAEDNGYDPDEYHQPMSTVNYNYYFNHPYPYWFGYPTFYDYPYWYPYSYWYPYPYYWNPFPYWYDWGFYYGPGGRMVIFGVPSYYFCHWHFYHPNYFYDYPVYTATVVDYYYGHRNSTLGMNEVVENWTYEHRDVLPSDWQERDISKRSDWFNEFGRMEAERQNYNRQNPESRLTSREYLSKNADKYPAVTRADGFKIDKEAIQRERAARQAYEQRDVQRDPIYEQPDERIRRQPYEAPAEREIQREMPQQRQQTIEEDYYQRPTPRNYQQRTVPRDYHQRNWDIDRNVPDRPIQRPQPQRRMQPVQRNQMERKKPR